MSAIAEIYDSITEFLKNTFGTEGTALINPYEIEENPEIILKRAFGFYMGPAQDQGTITSMVAINRDVIITLTIETKASQHNNEKRTNAEKVILDEHFKLVKMLHADPAVNEKVSGIIYQNDNGIEFIFGDKTNFLKIVSRFQMAYIENTGV